MAVTNKEVRVKLVVDAKDLEAGLKGAADKVDTLAKKSDSVNTLTDTFGKLGAGIVVVNQALELAKAGFAMLAGPIKSATNAYMEQEKAIMRLGNALNLAGEFSVETVEAFDEYADTLERTSSLSGPMVLDMLATAKAMGLTNDKAMQLVSAAADLAEAINVDASTAFNQLRGTLGGAARELGKYFPELKNLTEEQLKAGAAVDFLRTRFEGLAQASTQSLSGGVLQLGNAFGKVMEELGRMLVEFINLPGILRAATAALQAMATVLKFVSDTLAMLGDVGSIIKHTIAITALSLAYTAFNKVLMTSTALQLGATAGFAKLGALVGAQTVAVTSLGAAMLNVQRVAMAAFSLSLRGIMVVLAKAASSVAAFTTALLFNPLVLKAAAIAVGIMAFAKAIQEVFQEVSFLAESIRNFGAIFSKVIDDMGKSLNFFNNLRTAALVTFNVVKEVAKLLISGLLGAIVLVMRGIVGLMDAFARLKGETGKYSETIKSLETSIVELGAVIDKSLVNLANPIEALNEGLKEVNETSKEAGGALGGVNSVLRNMFDYDPANIRDRVFGDQFVQAALDYRKALVDLKITRDNLMRDEKQSAELVEKYRDAAAEHTRARFSAEKLIGDTLTNLRKTQVDQYKTMLSDQEKFVQLAKYESGERTKDLEETIRKVLELARVLKIPVPGLVTLRKALREFNEAEIKAAEGKELAKKLDAQQKKADELAAALKKSADALNAMAQATANLQAQFDNLTLDSKALIELERVKNISDALMQQDLMIKAGVDPKTAEHVTNQMIDIANKISAEKLTLEFEADLEATGIIGKLAGYFTLGVVQALDAVAPYIYDMFGDVYEKATLENMREIAVGAAKAVGYLVDGFIMAADILVFALSGAAIVFATGIVKAIGDIPETLANSFNDLDTTLSNFIAGFSNAVIRLVKDFPSILAKIIPKIGEFITIAVKALPHIFKAIADALPSIINALMDGIVYLLDKLPDMLLPIITKLPEIIAAILKRLPEIIVKLFGAIGEILAMLIKQLPDIIVEILQYLPEIIEGFISGLIGAIGDVAVALIDAFIFRGGIEKIVGAFLRAIPKIVWAVINGIAMGLKKIGGAISNMWKGGKKILPGLEGLTEQAGKFITDISRKVSKETSQMFQVKDLEESLKGVDIAEQISSVMNQALDRMVYVTRGIWQALKDAWLWVWNTILWPIIGFFREMWLWVWDNVLWPVIGALREVWLWIYETILKPVIDAFWVVFEWFYEKVAAPIIGILEKVANFLSDVFAKLFKAISDIGTTLYNFMKDIGGIIWEGLKKAFNNAKAFFGEIGGWIYDGLKKGLNGIGDYVMKIFDKLDPSSLFKKIFTIDYMGKGTVEKAINVDIPFSNFAKGGMVPGSAITPGDSLLNDRILALLSPGEAIIPRSMMNQPGIKDIVDAILTGQLKVPQFAFGGGLKAVGGAISGAAKDAGGAVSQGAKDAGGTISQAGKDLLDELGIDLNAAWKMIEEKTFGMVMKMFEANAFATGGIVTGQGFGDSVPAMLTPGEFVVKRSVAQNNIGMLNKLNQTGSGGGGGIVIEKIEINAKTNLDADSIRREVIPAIEKHLKRASLDGKPLIASSGVYTR